MSGAKAERPGLQEAFSFVRTGDTRFVWRLDRLGRSLKDLVQKVEDLQRRQVGFRSLHESIDTTGESFDRIHRINRMLMPGLGRAILSIL